MSHDLQMARSHSDTGFNLAIGEPVFLQRAFRFAQVPPRPNAWDPPAQYPALYGEPELLAQLKLLYPGKHIVVANGAKGALLAALYALNETHNWVTDERGTVVSRTPCWPSFPTLAQLSDMTFNKRASWAVSINTTPNNPDGVESDAPCTIWDACYASDVYGFDPKNTPAHIVGVSGAAKMLGLSAVRVGWLWTEDEKLAEKAAQYVEFTSSGVSVHAQRHVAHALVLLSNPLSSEAIEKAKGMLSLNRHDFNELILPHCEIAKGQAGDSAKGMFAYFKPKDLNAFKRALVASKVRVVSGEACGEKEPGWFRMNMGHLPQYTNEALVALSGALNG